MATNTVTIDQVTIERGNGANPEVFSEPCLINTDRGVQFTANFNADVVPDCDNITNPAQVVQIVDSISMSISGGGKLDRDDVETYVDALTAGTASNYRIRVGEVDGTGSVEIIVPMVLTNFNITSQRTATAECDITLESSGFEAGDVVAYTS